MPDTAVLDRIKDQISALVSEYVAEIDGELIPTEWVTVVGASKLDWYDRRQYIINFHPRVPYSARLGLLTSAQHDLAHIADNDD